MQVTLEHLTNQPTPNLAVATCFMEYKNQLLFLQRNNQEQAPNQWAIPGGKLETSESSLQALIREVREETGIYLSEANIEKSGNYIARHPKGDYALYLFRYRFASKPSIILNSTEHSQYKWIDIRKESILALDLIPGQFQAIKKAYSL